MSRSEDNEENIVTKIDNLCTNLNIDPVFAKNFKNTFLETNRQYTLEGDIVHWIGCALYATCQMTTNSSAQSDTDSEDYAINISLTELLRLCNLKLIQFFNKIKLWSDVASMSEDFKKKMNDLEVKFVVSAMLSKKFRSIFQEIFTGATNTSNSLFTFTWYLYICVKGEFPNSDDLVDMYHLLLSSLDYVYANAFMTRRTDLINPNFKGLPNNWQSDDFELPANPPSLISILQEIMDDPTMKLAVEALIMREYSWTPVIKSFFDRKILKGHKEQLMGVLNVASFETNISALKNHYENHVFSAMEFDERIFLSDDAKEQFGIMNRDETATPEVNSTFESNGRVCPDTPLSGQRYLPQQELFLSPVSEAANSCAHLTSYLQASKPQPSTNLLRLFSECGVSEESIITNLIQPCNAWIAQFSNRLRELECSNEIIVYRCNRITCLYFKILEHIITEEHKKKPQVSLQMLLSQDTYQLALYACCTEVILHVYGVHSLRFPEVLNIYNLSAFHFYKIIELVVQAISDKLSRDTIKHLNTVEELVLESKVWKSDSPLWEQLQRASVPSSAEVSLSESPNRRNNLLQSPASNVMERFLVPSAEHAKKQLFTDNIKPGQSLLVSTNNITVKEEPSTSQAGQSSSNGETSLAPNTPKKPNNSLILFFRKFYSLAVLRINDLCKRLELTDEELKRKIWTCLEYSIMHQTQVLKDRHLDQLLLCAVYVICKVSNTQSNRVERTFADIMRLYRQRPLANNHVYRYVLIRRATETEPEKRADLITFYNAVYVPCMQNFVLRFADGRLRNEAGMLSPLPATRGDAASSPLGLRVSERHQLYVRPLTAAHLPTCQLTYRFSRSPAKDLHAINTMVSSEVVGIKRASDAIGGEILKRARYSNPSMTRKLQGLVSDRQAV
ncbi:retinoblastoma-like protein 2 [Achroia grisella]|uniref:retinoblastoma-like protein 2 n=1 Tax=Achroia grisella TaxID=688607 RepID=UPI0027D29A86|nr:retinoblastoma-like protein 2 [Achroia grisella]